MVVYISNSDDVKIIERLEKLGYIDSGNVSANILAPEVPYMTCHTSIGLAKHLSMGTVQNYLYFIGGQTAHRANQASAKTMVYYSTGAEPKVISSASSSLEDLERHFNRLVSSTWKYIFSQQDKETMKALSKKMLADSSRMKKLADKVRGAMNDDWVER